VKVSLVFLLISVCSAAQTAPPVTGIRAINQNGQTFITWTDAAAGAAGANYRYNVYRSHSPITDASSLKSATLIQVGVLNNSGQMAGQFPYTQATRQDPNKAMSIIEQGSCGGPAGYNVCGEALPAFTGLAVHTPFSGVGPTGASAQASATRSDHERGTTSYYCVITTDRTHAQKDSPVSPGGNSTTAPLREEPASMVPLKYYDSNDAGHRAQASSTSISGTQNLPLWLNLHASGGCAGAMQFGDLYQWWGDSSEGYQEGVQNVFAVYEDHSTSSFGQRTLIALPCDTVWTADGLGQLETFWFGYLWNGTGPTYAYASTEYKLAWLLKWTIAHYGADPNRIYGFGSSMGGWGSSTWSLRHPEIFAAVFAQMPRFEEVEVASMVTKGYTNAAPSTLMSDGDTHYVTRQNTVNWVQSRGCGAPLPFIGWGIGRNDGYATWQEQVDMVNALKACRYGFAFDWNNGTHSDGPAAALIVSKQYRTTFLKNASYPAFTNSSLDNNPGSGSPTDGDLSGCINCGFTWASVTDTQTAWSASISNSKNTATMSVDITPRNTQRFAVGPGMMVAWTSSAGQAGTLVADQYGLVTAPRVVLNAGSSTTVAFSLIK